MDPIQINNIADLEELFPKNEDGNYDVNADEDETYSLAGADLVGANLSRAILERVNLSDANLSDANLTNTYLINANFTGADLSGTDLTGAAITVNTVNTMLKRETTLVGVIGINLTEQTLSFTILSNTLNPLPPNEYNELKHELLSKKDADERGPDAKGVLKKRKHKSSKRRHKSSKRRHKSSKRRHKSSKRRHRTFRK